MMPRTTINIEGPVLQELKRLQRREKKPLGRLVSDILAKALGEVQAMKAERPVLKWTATEMHAKVELDDKEAVYAAMENHAATRSQRRKPRK